MKSQNHTHDSSSWWPHITLLLSSFFSVQLFIYVFIALKFVPKVTFLLRMIFQATFTDSEALSQLKPFLLRLWIIWSPQTLNTNIWTIFPLTACYGYRPHGTQNWRIETDLASKRVKQLHFSEYSTSRNLQKKVNIFICEGLKLVKTCRTTSMAAFGFWDS